MASNTAETIAQSWAHKEQNMAAWRDEVARRLARRIRGEAEAKAAPVVIRRYPQRPGAPH